MNGVMAITHSVPIKSFCIIVLLCESLNGKDDTAHDKDRDDARGNNRDE
jgi:hypothetical protein